MSNPYNANPGQGQPAAPSSGSGSIMKVVLFVLLGLFLLCGGSCAGFSLLTYFAQKAAETFAHIQGVAQTVARNSPEVKEHIGEPIEFEGGFGDVKVENDIGTLFIRISGPKGKGKLRVQARGSGFSWKAEKVQLIMEDGHTIDLDPAAVNNAGNDPTNIEIPLPGEAADPVGEPAPGK